MITFITVAAAWFKLPKPAISRLTRLPSLRNMSGTLCNLEMTRSISFIDAPAMPRINASKVSDGSNLFRCWHGNATSRRAYP